MTGTCVSCLAGACRERHRGAPRTARRPLYGPSYNVPSLPPASEGSLGRTVNLPENQSHKGSGKRETRLRASYCETFFPFTESSFSQPAVLFAPKLHLP